MSSFEYATMATVDAIDESNPSFSSSAVAYCSNVWKKVYLEVMEQEDSNRVLASRDAGEAYRMAMPPLSTRENCRDFIACVAQGMLIGAITEKNGGKLLYAAQVALGLANNEQKSQNAPAPADPSPKRSRKSKDQRSSIQ